MQKITVLSDIADNADKKRLLIRLNEFAYNNCMKIEVVFIKSIVLDDVENEFNWINFTDHVNYIGLDTILSDSPRAIVTI